MRACSRWKCWLFAATACEVIRVGERHFDVQTGERSRAHSGALNVSGEWIQMDLRAAVQANFGLACGRSQPLYCINPCSMACSWLNPSCQRLKKFDKSMSSSAPGRTAMPSRLSPRDRLGRRRRRGWLSAAGLQTQEIFPGSQDGDGTNVGPLLEIPMPLVCTPIGRRGTMFCELLHMKLQIALFPSWESQREASVLDHQSKP